MLNHSPTFDDDLLLLRQHTDVVLLGEEHGPRVAIAPAWQGRVMTSSWAGDGPSFGWINRELIASGTVRPQFNAFGGEDRFWLGPEGGQFGLYFAPGAPFDFAHWNTPSVLDTEAYRVTEATARLARFEQHATLLNHRGTRFDLRLSRRVRLLNASEEPAFGAVEGLDRYVAYASDNTVTNIGTEPWRPESGLISIWILGMFQPSRATIIVLPFAGGAAAEEGPVVNDAYFGQVPPSRLRVGERAVFFRGDGEERGKIGLSPRRALPHLGSYDADTGALTVVSCTPGPPGSVYVNSEWRMQDAPYSGDVVNAYNDGPPAPGAPPLGPFYELESSSPALSLAPGESYTHTHLTLHAAGDAAALDALSNAVLQTSLAEIASAFG